MDKNLERGVFWLLPFGIRNILKKDLNILDVGCGNGYLLKKLKNLGFKNLYGIDISKKNIESAKDKGVKCIYGDVSKKVPFNDNFFDIVIAVAVLEHLLDD